MRVVLSLCVALVLTACASYSGRGLVPGQSTAADVERVMGTPADRRQAGAETWLYYPRQPYGRATYVARIGADGKLVAIEQRLTDANVAKIAPNATRGDQVLELLGPPYQVSQFPRMERRAWTWHMRHFGDPGVPVALVVQLSPDDVVREIYLLDESDTQRFSPSSGIGMGFGFGG